MSERVCRCCGRQYEHPAPASLSTRRNCDECTQLPEGVRAVLEAHLTEIGRLRRRLDKLGGSPPEPPTSD